MASRTPSVYFASAVSTASKDDSFRARHTTAAANRSAQRIYTSAGVMSDARSTPAQRAQAHDALRTEYLHVWEQHHALPAQTPSNRVEHTLQHTKMDDMTDTQNRKQFEVQAKVIVHRVVESFLQDLIAKDFNIFYDVDLESFEKILHKWICKQWYDLEAFENNEDIKDLLYAIIVDCNMRYRMQTKSAYFLRQLRGVLRTLIRLNVCNMMLDVCCFLPPDLNQIIATYFI